MTRAVFCYYNIVVKVHQNTKKEKVQKGKNAATVHKPSISTLTSLTKKLQ